MSKVTLHGEPINVGDKVWSIKQGWLKVTAIDEDSQYSIETDCGTYTIDGKQSRDNITPTIFWDEVEITIPPKPKPQFKKGDKVMVSQTGDHFLKRHYSHYEDGRHFCFIDGRDEWSSDKNCGVWFIVRYPTEEELKC